MSRLQGYGDTLPAEGDFRLGAAPLAAGVVTMAFGLLALLGWFSGWLQLASFGANRIPMAPSTAVLFLLYGTAISVRARTPLGRHVHGSIVALTGLGMLVSLLLFALGWLNIHWTGEHLGLNITGTLGGAPIGHMSRVTAFCFLLAGVSFLASRLPSAIRPWRVGLALVSAVGLLATSCVFLFAYGFGTPLLYGSAFIPPALNTILAFSTLGVALLALAGRPGGPDGPLGDDSRSGLSFFLIFLLLALGIAGTGYVYYRNYERQFRVDAEQQLTSVAELKIGELVQYRKERLSDAAILHNNPAFTHLVRRFLALPADADAQRPLQVWFDKYKDHFQYNQIRLLDTQGITRLSAPAGLAPVSSVVDLGASEALRSGQVTFQDFYRNEHDQRVYLALLIPILDEADGKRPLGVIVLRIDPAAYLYPFISRRPVPSESAETLLVRREGDEVVFLNELRFQANTALNLRHSLTNTTLPAAIAALGYEGIVTGVDYRGVPVLAAVRTVPDSPWFLVARQDVVEVYAPLRKQLWQVIVLVGVLLFGAGAGVGLVWRQQRVRFYRERAETAEALQKSQSLRMEAEKLGRSGGWEFDIESGLQSWTEMVYDIHELIHAGQLTAEQCLNFYTPKSRPIIEQALQRAIEQGESFDLELEIVTARGSRRNVRTSGRASLELGKVSGFIQDITERKTAEAALQKFAMLADSSTEFIGMCDFDFTPLYVNPAGMRMVGLPDLAAACQVKVQDYFFPEDRRFITEEFFPRVLREGKGDVEIRLRHFTTGKPIWMFYSLFNVRDASGEIVGWATVSHDITERKMTEQNQRQSRRAALNMMADAIAARERAEQMSLEISRLNAELEQRVAQRTYQLEAANKELEAFCYSVSHDLRAPLRHIDGYVELLLSRCRADLPEKGLHYLDTIAASARQMGALIDALLHFSRTGRAEMRQENTDMNQTLKEALSTLRESTSGRSIEWVISELPSVQGDHALLRQVWVNLLDNAIKYTKTREMARIEVCARQENGEIIFSVIDNGVGFDMKFFHKLFGVFQRLHSEEEFEGTGIGLATVQRIINRHGGQVWAEAELDSGATFYFTLPFIKENNHA